ncbi:MAG: ATP-dependent Clp protease ATP-binding subunit, partial [Oscillospiraceae bacterium]|nr:ATP-dependent Clp protease ATP-binding subunit [Oscillospiraceae bacterium]
MKCNRCKKRIAVVFITTMQGNEKHNEGLCLVCAKELGVPQVSEYMKQMGLTEDDIEEGYKMLFGDGDEDDFFEDDEEDEGIDAFKAGGAGTMPKFLQNLFRDTGLGSGSGSNALPGLTAVSGGSSRDRDKSTKEKKVKKS